MSLLEELNTLISASGVPVETGVFSDTPPDRYVVITPMTDTFRMYADDRPRSETQEARLSLFDKGNYLPYKKQIVSLLLAAGFTITERRYIGYEPDTKYHHCVVDVEKEYETEE